jgi:hypothetical protein
MSQTCVPNTAEERVKASKIDSVRANKFQSGCSTGIEIGCEQTSNAGRNNGFSDGSFQNFNGDSDSVWIVIVYGQTDFLRKNLNSEYNIKYC